MPKTNNPSTPIDGSQPAEHDRIEALAHQLWVMRGCPQGSPGEDWTQAEQQLRMREQSSRSAAA
jgi:hypothetical protein